MDRRAMGSGRMDHAGAEPTASRAQAEDQASECLEASRRSRMAGGRARARVHWAQSLVAPAKGCKTDCTLNTVRADAHAVSRQTAPRLQRRPVSCRAADPGNR